MRLKPEEVHAIKHVIHTFDADAKIYLYGSRVDDTRKGGDIDLLVLSKKISFEERIKIKLKLYDTIGEQKIDLVFPGEHNQAFIDMIFKESILL